MIDPVQAIDPVQYRSHTSPRSTACPADYTQCQVRKRSNECENEKRLVKRQWLGVALTECGARGTLAVHALPPSTACGRKTALPSRENASTRSPLRGYTYHIFPTGSLVQNFRSVLAHASICSPSRETASIIFRAGARMEPHQWGSIFCTRDRARETPFAFFLSTAERRLTADRSDRFSVRVIAHERHLLLSFYLPPSVGLLLTVWTDFLYA